MKRQKNRQARLMCLIPKGSKSQSPGWHSYPGSTQRERYCAVGGISPSMVQGDGTVSGRQRVLAYFTGLEYQPWALGYNALGVNSSSKLAIYSRRNSTIIPPNLNNS